MATDMRLLLTGLIEYHGSLSTHMFKIREEFQKLENFWRRLNSEYEGTGAEEFRIHWGKTAASFNEYISQGQRISLILQERIEALQAADSAEGL